VAADLAKYADSDEARLAASLREELLTPIAKGWSTDVGVEVASMGLQVHGGMGFIEETGVAQFLRDARITTIYEGTTGIQANDLIGRKLGRDGGLTAQAVIAEMRALHGALAESPSLKGSATVYADAVAALERGVQYAVAHNGSDIRSVAAGAVPLLKLFGIAAGGWQLLRSALIAEQRLSKAQGAALAPSFYQGKIATAQFYANHVLCQAPGLAHAIVEGAAGTLAETAL